MAPSILWKDLEQNKFANEGREGERERKYGDKTIYISYYQPRNTNNMVLFLQNKETKVTHKI